MTETPRSRPLKRVEPAQGAGALLQLLAPPPPPMLLRMLLLLLLLLPRFFRTGPAEPGQCKKKPTDKIRVLLRAIYTTHSVAGPCLTSSPNPFY